MPPEEKQDEFSNQAYDADMDADVAAAFKEVATGEPAAALSVDPVKTDTPERTDAERARDEAGRFAKKDDQPKEVAPKPDAAPKAPDQQQAKPAEQQVPEQQQQASTDGRPPPGWSVKSKAAWDQLPADVRADVVKREMEIDRGFQKLRDYKGLDSYAEMARQSGTTLDQALRSYTSMEQALRANPAQGLIAIGQNLNLSPGQIVELLSPYAGGGVSHSQGQQSYQQGQFDPNDPFIEPVLPVIQPLMQEVSELKSQLQQMIHANQTREEQAALSVVDQVASDPKFRYFANLQGDMHRLLQSGMVPRTGNARIDLEKVYEVAARLNPEVSEQIVNDRVASLEAERKAREKEILVKAKAASRSISGSPSPGTVIKTDDDDDGSPEADARRAYREVMAAR